MGNHTKVTEATGFAPGTMKLVHADDKSILLVNVDGHVYALSDICTHRGCHLSKGKLSGKVVKCPCHSSQFDVTTGAVIASPAQKPLASYQVKIEGSDILVAI